MSKLALRPYQEEAIEAVFKALARGEHPVISIATGGGKSLIAAEIARQIEGRVLIVTHRQELLEQNGSELLGIDPDISLGYYSAGLGKRDTKQRVIMGGIQSVYSKIDALQQAGEFTTIICDEAHAVAPRESKTMYSTVFSACSTAHRIGLSATPYRLDNGPIFDPAHCWFDTLAYEATISQLTPEYLVPLRGVRTAAGIDVSQVRIRGGEFVESDLSQAACEEAVVNKAMDELVRVGATRKSWIVFCVDVAHTELVTAALRSRSVTAACLVGSTHEEERADILSRMQSGALRCLVNCMVATTGFNIKRIDLIAMLRPTMSKSLVVQMIGRGSRQFEEKEDCLVLDFAENIMRHKPLDGIPIVGRTLERIEQDKQETEKQEEKERERKEREAKHRGTFSDEDPFGESLESTQWHRVERMTATIIPSRNPHYPGKAMIRVGYLMPDRLAGKWVSQFLCIEYPGWPRDQAIAWLQQHGWEGYVPQDVREIKAQWRRRVIAPTYIQVEKQGKYEKVLRERMPEKNTGFWDN